ncbi:hypothetical protein FF011L_03420 [Roseimaritima multifibrata]|uniref:Uncharacterized protein n=1 Tax=Roseimaritima multifibrata TaxID=1930274 RepID=A0A517M9P9_9BACT|nr:hypothetical protein FF011L_03420 [Roseimaritima multifibrata]
MAHCPKQGSRSSARVGYKPIDWSEAIGRVTAQRVYGRQRVAMTGLRGLFGVAWEGYCFFELFYDSCLLIAGKFLLCSDAPGWKRGCGKGACAEGNVFGDG